MRAEHKLRGGQCWHIGQAGACTSKEGDDVAVTREGQSGLRVRVLAAEINLGLLKKELDDLDASS